MTYFWTAASMRDGSIIADLPNLICDKVTQRICTYQTVTASLPVGGQGEDRPPIEWQRATLEGGAVAVLLDDPGDGTQPVPVWGGWVSNQVPQSTDEVPLSLSTMEAYLDRRYVGDVTFTATDQNAIVSSLISSFVNDGSINIRVQVVGGAGTVRDRTYTDASDKSILSVLTELSAVIGGPEWTIGWEWQHSPERLTPVLYVGTRLGSAVTAGLGPSATFEMPGSVDAATLTRDYQAGKGANNVMAVSTASVGTRPQSPRQVYVDPSRPTFEYRYTPSTSISDVTTMTSHAQATLAAMQNGSRTLTLVAAVEEAPRLGTNWFIGDDIGYVVGGYDSTGADTVPAFPGGIAGTARAVGWELTLNGVQTVTPLLDTIGA